MKVDNKRLTKKVNIRIGIGHPTTLAFQRRKHMSLPLVLSTRGLVEYCSSGEDVSVNTVIMLRN